MTKSLVLFSALFIAGCAGPMKDMKRTQFKLDHTYLFTSNDGEDFLKVKLLIDPDPKKRHLLAKRMSTPDTSPIQIDDPSVMNIWNFYIDKEGRLSFRYYTDGKSTMDLVKEHPLCKAASSENYGKYSVWYRFDFEKAKMIE